MILTTHTPVRSQSNEKGCVLHLYIENTVIVVTASTWHSRTMVDLVCC